VKDVPLPEPPPAPLDRITRPLARFLHVEATSGIVLLACTAVALLAANTGLRDAYARFWETEVRVGAGGFELAYPLWYWVNDALMAIFFFVIGLELKRELVMGELSEPRKVALPVLAAVGGAAAPALIFLGLRAGTDDARGWAVPMATDIAFVVGVLSVLGPSVPRGLKVFAMSLAIVDDLLAVLVIAAVFTETIRVGWLLGAAGGFAAVFGMQRAGVRPVGLYVIVGAGIWLCTLKSGVHPTVAGALLGLATPARAWVGTAFSREVMQAAAASEALGARAASRVEFAVRESVSPLERLEAALHPWVGFVVMPIFALANAAVPISPRAAGAPLALAVAAGLAVGKPLGILLVCAAAARAGWARLPEGVSWRVLLGGGCLCGIGFTMAIFVASLAFTGEALIEAKTGVLVGSVVSALLGAAVLRAPRRARSP
jgi:NhaA family Na+:H+ antiporter